MLGTAVLPVVDHHLNTAGQMRIIDGGQQLKAGSLENG